MFSASHKSSSDTDSKSAANLQRKATSQQNGAQRHSNAESKNDSTAVLQRIIQDGASQSGPGTRSIQPKLSVGKPGDKYEDEAESKADKVMRMPSPASAPSQIQPVGADISRMVQAQVEKEKELQKQPMEEDPKVQAKNKEKEPLGLQAQPMDKKEEIQRQENKEELQAQPEKKDLVQRQPSSEEEELQMRSADEEVQRKNGSESRSPKVDSSFESTLSETKSSGKALPGSVRNFMEPRFGADFSNVRIHAGSEAAKLSQNINAQAFTHGRDIYFNEGKYDPNSSGGKHLIAHELTHTIQQGAVVQTKEASSTTASSSSPKVQRSWIGDAWNAVSGAASGAAEWVGDSLEAGKDWLMGKIKGLISDVPGYKLFTVVLGEDPITGKNVARNGLNFIEAGLDIIPNGEAYRDKLKEEGALSEAATWLDKQMKTLEGVSLKQVTEDFNTFWEGLSLTDVRDPQKVLRHLLRVFSTPMNKVISFAENVASKFLEIVKEYLLAKVVEFIKKKQSPTFYPLLTVVLGEDPITGKEVDRSGKNILTGFIKLHPKGDKQLKKMKETGSFGRAVRWVDKSIVRIEKIASGLGEAFTTIWDEVTDINSLLNPISTFNRIYTKFQTPLVQLADFMWTVGKKILSFVKDALLSRLSAFARNTRGYPLITVILGKDPFTGNKVPRTMENVIKGFFSLMPNGEQQFKKLKKSGAITQMTSWMSGAIERLNISWETIVGLFKAAWERLTIDALMQPIKAFKGIVKLFSPPIRRLINFVGEVVKKVIEIVLKIMNFPTKLIGSIFSKTAAVFGLIKSDPIGFIKNLLRGLKQGFQQFFNNIGTHLSNGLTDWLFGTLSQAGIKPPPDLSFKSVLGMVLDILGITKERIFDKIAQKVGREKMKRIRGFIDKVKGIWSFVKDVMARGPVAIWEYVQEKISNLWDMVFEQVKSWIMEKVITKVTTKLLSMLDPSGVMAVVNSFIAIYNAIESFVAYFTKMLKMVNRFVMGVAAIARGNLAPAANKLESALSKGIPIAIGFLANQVGLSGLGKKISKMIEAVRTKVDSAIDWLIDKAMKAGGAIVNIGKSAVGAISSWWKNRKKVRTKDQKEHEIFFEGSGTTAKLMIASNPKRYIAYLDSLKGSYDLTDEDLEPVKSKAGEIEAEKSKNVSEEDRQNHGAKINNLVDELVKETAKLPLSSSGKTNTPPFFGPVRQGFGTLARVSYLQAPHDEGSSPTVSNTPEFNSMNLRRKGGGAYYVKGHLLNDNLGGPGNTWSNLTPLTVQANADHKTEFENPVKQAVNGTTARGANPDETKGHVRDFSVRAEYGRTLPSSYHTLVNEDTDEVPSGMPEDVSPFKIARVIRAEQYVPTRLICKAEVKYRGGQEEQLNETITNDIQYGQLSSYSLNASPRQDYVLADHIDFNADSKQKAVEDLMQLNGIGPARAIRIYDGLKESGRIYDYKKQIGITKKTIEKNNPGYRITGGTYSG